MGFGENYNSQNVKICDQGDFNADNLKKSFSMCSQKNSSIEDTYGSTILSPSDSGSDESELMDSSNDQSIIVSREKRLSKTKLDILTPPPSRQNFSSKRIQKKTEFFTPSPIRVSKVKKSKKIPKKKSTLEISRAAFKRIVLEILEEQSVTNPKIEENAIEALQEASENLLTEHFVTLGRMMDLSNKRTLTINTLMLYNTARANV